MQLKKSNKVYYIYIAISILIILIYMSPYIIQGTDSHLLIFDNLDGGGLPPYNIMTSQNYVFRGMNFIIPNFLNGIPRNMVGTEFNFNLWLHNFFNPFSAYMINKIIMHIVAFVGMFLLLNNHFKKRENNILIICGVSICFAILPFWPLGGLSVAGLPLALYSFMNIRSGKDRKSDWLIIGLIPFYSSFIYSFSFFLFCIFIIWLFDLIKYKNFNRKLLISILTMILIFMLIEYRLIYSLFQDNIVSNRVEYIRHYYNSLDTLTRIISNFIFGHHHAASLQQYSIGVSVLISIILMVLYKKINKKIVFFTTLSLLISIWYGIWSWEALLPIKNKINFLNIFNLSRFHWLHPLLWYITFALALIFIQEIIKNKKIGAIIITIFIASQIIFLFYNSDFFVEKRNGSPTYKQFYAVDQFNSIKEFIGDKQSNYKVVSIGMHPSIAQYNGFYTLDGYFVNYPLQYKHEFRKVIERELAKNKELRDYFDNRGVRSYIFVDELGRNFMFTKLTNKIVYDLDLNTHYLKDMDCEYIISAVNIQNHEDNDLELLKIFEDNNSAWRIFLYKLN